MRNWSAWCEPMSTRIPPVASGSQNQSGRPAAPMRWGPRPSTDTTRPMSPRRARRHASATARFSKRSPNITHHRRSVPASASSMAASPARVVTPGLSATTCLPARSARTAMSPRSEGMAAVTMRSMLGSSMIASMDRERRGARAAAWPPRSGRRSRGRQRWWRLPATGAPPAPARARGRGRSPRRGSCPCPIASGRPYPAVTCDGQPGHCLRTSVNR
jgi:hypothetical protein